MIKGIMVMGLFLGMVFGTTAMILIATPAGNQIVPDDGAAVVRLGPSEYGGHHSSEIKGVFVVKADDKTGHETDNLLDDPNNIVVGEALSDAAFSTGISVDWGVEYVLVIAVWGDNADTSLDKQYMRVGIDGDEWGDGNGLIDWVTENIGASNSYYYNEHFQVAGENHIAVNFWASPAFTLVRDETVTVDNILYQVYK